MIYNFKVGIWELHNDYKYISFDGGFVYNYTFVHKPLPLTFPVRGLYWFKHRWRLIA